MSGTMILVMQEARTTVIALEIEITIGTGIMDGIATVIVTTTTTEDMDATEIGTESTTKEIARMVVIATETVHVAPQ